MQDVRALNELVAKESAFVDDLLAEIGKVIVGQTYMIERILIGLLTGGHVLLEGVPGLAKTLTVRTICSAIHAKFARVQFTPDLLPADLIGTVIYDQKTGQFSSKLGPIFANLVLADEINRAPAKVQSALLEAMQERQVTIGLESHSLPDPFLVMANMNPLDADGTYALPLAQMDRFLLKINVDYPTAPEEATILERFAIRDTRPLHGIASLEDLQTWRARARAVHVEEPIKRYIVDIVVATREAAGEFREYVDRGASPRATLAIVNLARARAVLEGRDFVVPDDVRAVASDALRHRIGFNYRLQTQNVDPEAIVRAFVAGVPAP